MKKFEIKALSDRTFDVDNERPNSHSITFSNHYMTHQWGYSGYDIPETEDDVMRGLTRGKYRSFDGMTLFSVDKFCSLCLSFNTDEEMYDLTVRFSGDVMCMRHEDKSILEPIASKILEWHRTYIEA